MTFKKKHQILTISMLIGSCLVLLLSSFASFAQQCDSVKNEVLRLHVLANSDSREDQDLKYLLRDYLTDEMKNIFSDSETLENAVQTANEYLSVIEEKAKMFILNEGYEYDVLVSLENMYFTTRVYENITMPAGNYNALRIIIGEGTGRNWWCVIFPPLCLPAASESAPYFSAEANKIIENGSNKVEVKFKAYEWVSKLLK